MNTEIEQYERIQEYLRGRMSDEERTAFERELATDDSLRKQCDDLRLLARSIIRANQEADLRMALEEIEKELAESPKVFKNDSDLSAELSRVEMELQAMEVSNETQKGEQQKIAKKKRFLLFPQANWSSRGIWISSAIAACLLFAVCTISFLGYHAQKVGYEFILSGGERGTTEIEALMEMRDNNAAIAKIAESREWIETEKENPMYDDQIYLDNLRRQEQELDFLEAICQLRRWHYFSGKKSLKKIANGGGAYAEEAQRLLRML